MSEQRALSSSDAHLMPQTLVSHSRGGFWGLIYGLLFVSLYPIFFSLAQKYLDHVLWCQWGDAVHHDVACDLSYAWQKRLYFQNYISSLSVFVNQMIFRSSWQNNSLIIREQQLKRIYIMNILIKTTVKQYYYYLFWYINGNIDFLISGLLFRFYYILILICYYFTGVAITVTGIMVGTMLGKSIVNVYITCLHQIVSEYVSSASL